MRFEELTEFKKDLKQLLKEFSTLNEDLNVVKRVLEVHPGERPPFSYRIRDTGTDLSIIKFKKIACRSLKDDGANSGLRLIYTWLEEEEKIVFIELYHKSDKEKENRPRIMKHFK